MSTLHLHPSGRRNLLAAAFLLFPLVLIVSLSLPRPTTAAFPGANGKIVFTSYRTGNGDIYIMDADGSNLTRLTTSSSLEQGATWSPDGSQIAYSSNYAIYIMDADGSNVRQVTDDGEWPAWSPDGTKLAFMRCQYCDDIWVINTDGTGATQLTSNSEREMWPDWSPDGTKIVYHRKLGDTLDKIFVMNADGTGQTQLTTGPSADYFPKWSPDGTKIIFTSNRDPDGEIYVMNADGSGITQITNNTWPDQTPAFSPDGTKIVWESYLSGNWEIHIANANGSNPTRLTNSAGHDLAAQWQPLTSILTIAVSANVRSEQGFAFTGDCPGFESFTLVDNGVGSFRRRAVAGEWTCNIQEMVPDGWELENAICDNGQTAATIDIGPGDDVTCTFRNSIDRGSLTIAKNSTPVGAEDFSFQLPATFLYSWGSGGSGASQFNQAVAMAIDWTRNRIYIVDYDNNRIQTFDHNGSYLAAWGSAGAGTGQFNNPSGIAVDENGTVYVADTFNDRIQKFDGKGNQLLSWGGTGTGNGQFSSPTAVASDGSGHIYVADYGNNRVQKFDLNGGYLGKWGGSGGGNGQFNGPHGLDVMNGRVYVTDSLNHRVQVFDLNGAFITKWGSEGTGDTQFGQPMGITVGEISGLVYVTDAVNSRVQLFDANGGFLAKWGSLGSGNGQFYGPLDVGLGVDGLVYVADARNNRIQVFNAPQWAMLDDGQEATFNGLVPTSYTVMEMPKMRWQMTSSSCSNGNTINAVSITAGGGVTCQINNVRNNAAPVAAADSYAVMMNQSLTVPANGVLGNDTDADSDPLTAARVAAASHGTVTLNSNGSFTYTPTAAYYGMDSFTYRANDGQADSFETTVSIKVNATPITFNDAYRMNPNTTLVVGATTGVLANDQDPNGDALVASVMTQPAHGSLSLNGDGSFTFTPTVGFVGEDSFTYHSYDGIAYSAAGTARIIVDTAPVANADTYTARTNIALSVGALGVLLNDHDPDGSPMYAQLVSNVSHGALTLYPSGAFWYQSVSGYIGTDRFTYRVTDSKQQLFSNTVEVVINVYGPPDGRPDYYSTWEDSALTVYAPGLDGNDYNPTGGALSVIYYSLPSRGTLTARYADGTFVYVPARDFFGVDYFQYAVCDGTMCSPNLTLVTIYVNSVNDPPVAINNSYRVAKNNWWNVIPNELRVAPLGVLSNDFDSETTLSELRARWLTGPGHGSYGWSSDGSFSYKPSTGFVGTDWFTYNACDGLACSNTASVSISVYDPAKTSASGTTSGATQQSALAAQLPSTGTQGVIVSGGSSGGAAQQSNAAYNPSTGQSQALAPMPSPRAGQSAYVSQAPSQGGRNKEADQPKMIVIGGVDENGDPLATTALYDAQADSWADGPEMSEPRVSFGSAEADNGDIVIAGGFNGSVPTASVDRYNVASNTIEAITSMDQARMHLKLVRLPNFSGYEGEYFMAIGGQDAGLAYLASTEVYDPTGGGWVATGDLNIARAGHTATTLLDGRVLVVGGYTDDGPTATAEVFDPTTGQWSLVSSQSAPVTEHTATLLQDGTVLIIGAADGESLMEIFSPATGEWYPTAAGTEGRGGHTATLLDNGQVVIIGGTVSGTGRADEAETDLVEIYWIEPVAYVTVVKETEPVNSDVTFAFTSTITNSLSFSLDGGPDADAVPTEITFGPLTPGEYSIGELAAAGYSQSVRCDSGDSGTGSITLDLVDGETVTCTFSNELDRGTVRIGKLTSPAGLNESFAFTTTYALTPTFSLSDGEMMTLTLPVGSYSVAEEVPEGFGLGALTCDQEGVSDLANTRAVIVVNKDETVTCSFLNQKNPAGQEPPRLDMIFVSTWAAGKTTPAAGSLSYGPHDILMWNGTVWTKWFDGAAAGLKPSGKWKHNVNAFYIPNPAEEHVYLSLTQNQQQVGSLGWIDGYDIIYWNGASFSRWFEGEQVGLNNKTQEKIDGLHILSQPPMWSRFAGQPCEAYLLISTQGAGIVPNPTPILPSAVLRFAGEDVLGFCATTIGASTAGSWEMVLDGSAAGVARSSIDSISATEDGMTLYVMSKGTFHVDAAFGGHSDVFVYDMLTGTFSGPAIHVHKHGLPYAKVDAMDIH